MSARVLTPRELSSAAFSPYGDVIEETGSVEGAMNDRRFQLFQDLANIDVDTREGGRAAVSIARSLTATELPYTFSVVERHPLGSQAFVPLTPFRFIVVVAPPTEEPAPGNLAAFVSNGHQGISYRRGTWHMPLIALAVDQSFLVVDRVDGGENCDLVELAVPVTLEFPEAPL